MGERLILVMDGSTHACSAALLAATARASQERGAAENLEEWRVVARRADIQGREQARLLLRWVDDMLRESEAVSGDIAAVVVGTGPGTFTGVRIAVATARALALALTIPVLGVSTLSCLAADAAERAVDPAESAGGEEVGRHPDLIIPVVDARRGQVFFGLYEADGPAGIHAGAAAIRVARTAAAPLFRRREPFAVCDVGALVPLVSSRVPNGCSALIVGEPVLLAEGASANPAFYPAPVRAERLVIGQGRLEEPGEGVEGRRLGSWLAGELTASIPRDDRVCRVDEPGGPETVKPIYVRSPDADIHITKMRDPWADSSVGR